MRKIITKIRNRSRSPLGMTTKRKRKARTNNGKSKGNNRSLRPSGYAPAFGRAVCALRRGFFVGLKPTLNPKDEGKSTVRQEQGKARKQKKGGAKQGSRQGKSKTREQARKERDNRAKQGRSKTEARQEGEARGQGKRASQQGKATGQGNRARQRDARFIWRGGRRQCRRR
jgi:hypothetical protein